MSNILQGATIYQNGISTTRLTLPEDMLTGVLPDGSTRTTILALVHIFSSDYTIVPPTITSPFLASTYGDEILYLAALAGSVAKSAASITMSPIKKITEEVIGLPSEENGYGASNKFDGKITDYFGYLLQPNGTCFNDLSVIAYTINNIHKVSDYPYEILKSKKLGSDSYLYGRTRSIIGTNQAGKNITLEIPIDVALEEVMLGNGLVSLVGSSPRLITNGKALDRTDVLADPWSDARHYIAHPYCDIEGPWILRGLVEMHRNGRTSEIISAIYNDQTIQIPIYGTDIEKAKESIIKDKRYGQEYQNSTRFEVVNGVTVVKMPGLREAYYNHLLFGLTKKGEIVVVQTSGRNGKVTGNNGITLTEATKLARYLCENFNIQTLWFGSQGNDVSNIVNVNKGAILDLTGVSDHIFRIDLPLPRGKATSDRIFVAKKIA